MVAHELTTGDRKIRKSPRPSDRKQAEAKPSGRTKLLRSWRSSALGMRLKAFARACAAGDRGPMLLIAAQAWLHNKRANFSKPLLGIGKTHRPGRKGGRSK